MVLALYDIHVSWNYNNCLMKTFTDFFSADRIEKTCVIKLIYLWTLNVFNFEIGLRRTVTSIFLILLLVPSFNGYIDRSSSQMQSIKESYWEDTFCKSFFIFLMPKGPYNLMSWLLETFSEFFEFYTFSNSTGLCV